MKRTPLHYIQLEAGGIAATFGEWERIAIFGDPEMEAATAHESAIIMDSSSFGKFSITGKDAAKAIGRVIPKSVEDLKPGHVTHFVLLDENGCGIDDGVVSRRSDNEFYLMTSTGRSATFQDWITKHCSEAGFDYKIADQSHDFAAINLAGPKAREILSAITEGDISKDAFRFMRIKDMDIANVPCRVLRIGFLGELGFELHVPSGEAVKIWNKLRGAGELYGAKPTAIMGMSVLRLEKGHIIPGHDIDGTANLFEAGMSFTWDRGHTGFVGEDALKALENNTPERRLVRFQTQGKCAISPAGIMMAGDEEVGKMPSVHYSHILDKTIGISFAKNHKNLITDGKVRIKTEDGIVGAEVLKGYSFFDPKGKRMRS